MCTNKNYIDPSY